MAHDHFVKELNEQHDTQLKQQQMKLMKENEQKFMEELQKVREELHQHYQTQLHDQQSDNATLVTPGGEQQHIQVCDNG